MSGGRKIGNTDFLEKRQKNGLGRQKISRRERGYEGKGKTETKRVIEKGKFLAQNFQKVGILFILKEPPASLWGSKRQ